MTVTSSPRVVITGLGIVSPIGIGTETFWSNLHQGRSGVSLLSAFPNQHLPSKLAAEIKDFNPYNYVSTKRLIKVMPRDVQLGIAAAKLAMSDADLVKGDISPERLGVTFGSGRLTSQPQEVVEAVAGLGNSEDVQTFANWATERMGKINPLWLLRQLPNMAACHISIDFDAQGPNNTITSRESSALLALGEAYRTIVRDAADVMIVGASSSMIDPVDISRLNLFESLSRRQDNPERACRPFDRDRDGAVVGEGAGVFVLESYEHAVRRGADIYAEIIGVGAGCDGIQEPQTCSMGLVRAMQSALRRSGIRPEEIGHINAHGKSTQRDDVVESTAYRQALGPVSEKIPITALTSYFGFFDAGTGAVELAGSLLALRHQELPMTLNYETPDPGCPLNVVRSEPLRLKNSIGMSVNRTHLGQSAACLFRSV
jgi:3-oxoacyl-[acyl-carrier-protein] synthase II